MDLDSYFRSHIGKKIAVCGIGVSNIPLIRLLRERELEVEARDKKSFQQLGKTGEDLEAIGVKLVLGDDYLRGLDADIIYRSPGMMPNIPEFTDAVARGSTLTSEMEAFFEVCPCKTIGITGSDGKTTTSTLIANILELDGKKAWLGGNIGMPLLERVPEMAESDYAVVELSSFQLMSMKKSPEAALVTNITPNHLDIHRDMEEYIEAKRAIYKYEGCTRVVLNLDNPITRSFIGSVERGLWVFSKFEKSCEGYPNCVYMRNGSIFARSSSGERRILECSDILIPGMHNVENYMAAIAALHGNVQDESFRDVAVSFAGVEHRIEFVRTYRGVRYYNDSIASSPTRTIAGLNSFDQKVVLIAGGYDKQIPFGALAEQVPGHVKALILMGATRLKIKDAVEKEGDTRPPIYLADSLEDAVTKSKEISKSGDIVLFSPACASFDMFSDFAQRGRAFKDIINTFV